MPPRHGKSELISHWLPTWFLDIWPHKRVIITSYADSLAKFFGRKVRNELQSNPLCVTRVMQDGRKAGDFETVGGGGLITAGVGGPITGRGGDLLLVDDPLKNWEEAYSQTTREKQIEWFTSTLYTRKEPGATIIVLMTRWHERDLAGWLQTEHQDTWDLINFPAIAETEDEIGRREGEALCVERYDLESLQKIEKGVGPRVWNALYQGRPAPAEGAMWKRQHWKRWTTLPKFDEVIQSWDTKATNVKNKGSSYVVGEVWGRTGADCYLLWQVRDKWGFTEMLDQFRIVTARFPEGLRKLVENKANGPAAQDSLCHEIQGIILVEPEGGKESRAMAVQPLIEAGNVWLPADNVTYDWVDGFIEEAAAFPNSAHNDQVDTASQALRFLSQTGIIAYGGKERDKEKPKRRMR
jgi:predicted phage terminase large subunit-like protein